MKTIELGQKHDDHGVMGANIAPSSDEKEEKIWYPCLYLDGAEGIQDLDEEGEAIIRYKRKSITLNNDGKPPSGEIEIHSITPTKSKTKKTEEDELEEAMRDADLED